MLITAEGEHEGAILAKFKLQVEDLKQDEETLLRFLRAREHNLQKAEDMLRKSITWKKEKNFESVLTWNIPKFIKEDLIVEWTGSDNEGLPVMYAPVGRWNTRQIIMSGHKNDVIDFSYYVLESAMYKLKEDNCSQATFIANMEELTMWKVANFDTMQVLYNAFQDLETNYPEIIRRVFIINAPWAFSVLFNVVKPILSAHTLSKVHVYSSSNKSWYQDIRQHVPESSLPASICRE